MVNFDALRVPITGDDRDLRAALARSRGQISAFARASSANVQRVERSTRSLQTSASAATRSMNRLLGAFVSVAALRGMQQLVDASTRIENSLKVAGLSGEELSRVYDRLFISAQRNAAPIEALTELYGRAALVQKELGVSTEELLGFTDKIAVALRVSGKSAAESSGALLQLSQALGSGIVRAEEFNSILEGALPIAQAAAAGLEEAGGSVAKLRQLVIDGKISSEVFFRAFEAGAAILEGKVADAENTVSQGLIRLQNALTKTAGKFDEATGASNVFVGALGAVADAIEAVGNAADEGFTPALARKLTEWFGALESAEERAIGALRLRLKLQQSGALAMDEGFSRADFGASDSGATEVIPVSAGAYDPPSTKKDSSAKLDDYQKEIAAIGRRTSELRLEADIVGRSRREIEKRRAALELEQAAEKAGLAITPERRAQIEQLSAAYADQNEVLQRVIDAQARIEAAAQASFDAVKSGFVDVISGAKSFKDAFAEILQKLVQIALNNAFESVFAPAIGGASGGTLGAVFSSLGKVLGFANGGVMTPSGPRQLSRFAGGGISDRPAIFGEGSLPEAAVPLPDGHSIPVKFENGMGASAMMQDRPVKVVVEAAPNPYFDIRVKEISRPIARDTAAAGIAANEKLKQRRQWTHG